MREDTVRFWRSAFMTGGIEALKTAVAPGPAPVKAERALAVAEEVLSAPVADRPNWTLPRLADEVEKRSGMRISRSRLSVVLRHGRVAAEIRAGAERHRGSLARPEAASPRTSDVQRS